MNKINNDTKHMCGLPFWKLTLMVTNSVVEDPNIFLGTAIVPYKGGISVTQKYFLKSLVLLNLGV